jgi:hypothetical protein
MPSTMMLHTAHGVPKATENVPIALKSSALEQKYLGHRRSIRLRRHIVVRKNSLEYRGGLL